MLDQLQGRLAEHFGVSVAYSVFELEMAGHASHENATPAWAHARVQGPGHPDALHHRHCIRVPT